MIFYYSFLIITKWFFKILQDISEKKNTIIFFDIFPFANCDMYLDIKDLHYK